MKSISEITPQQCSGLAAVFSDIDDTLTINGKIPLEVLGAVRRIRDAGIRFVLITGRPVGFGVTLTNYFDLFDMVITENGGTLSRNGSVEFVFDHLENPDNYQAVRSAAHAVREAFPEIQDSTGNYMRLSDFAFKRAGLSDSDIGEIEHIAAGMGINVVASSIQVHLYRGDYDKGKAILRCLETCMDGLEVERILTMGDSPNDEAMLDSRVFPISAGVANLRDFEDRMQGLPSYIAQARGADGALEIFNAILSGRKS